MASNGKIPVELTPEQMADLIDAATRAAEQDQEDAEILMAGDAPSYHRAAPALRCR